MPSPYACTIVSNNYLPFARVFARSFLEHHPDGRVWTLIVDRPAGELTYDNEPFEVVFAYDLGIPRFQTFAFRYSILELNTAVKPYFLEYLHRRFQCERICYFDPDIRVTGDLSPIYEALETAEVVLTPHILEPLEDDGHPSERDFLLSGIYNLGFLGIAIRPTTLRYLEWWQQRLYYDCLHRTDRGLFVDQRWMDFAPAFLRAVKILRDPGYNVAYWNLPHRTVEEVGDGYRVDGHPLRFFHFSGIRVDDPEAISRYQDRYTLADRPDVRPLFGGYRERLKEEGFDELRRIRYAYGQFDDGTRIPQVARQLLQKIDPDGDRWSDPFDAGAERSYFRWLWRPVPAECGIEVPRLAIALWDARPDLQSAFPFPLSSDADAYARWFVEEVGRTADLDASLGEVVSRSLEARGLRAPKPREDSPDAGPHAFSRLISRTQALGPRLRRPQLKWWASSGDLETSRELLVPRLGLMIRDRRSDLAVSFPDPLGRSRLGFAVWFVTFGRLEYRLPRSVVRQVLCSLPLRQRTYATLWWIRYGVLGPKKPTKKRLPEPEVEAVPSRSVEKARVAPPDEREPLGLNVIGWLGSPTGVGEVARGTVLALEEEGLPYGVCNLRHPALDEGEGLIDESSITLDMRYGVALYHVNADMMGSVHDNLPLMLTTSQEYTVGYWFWELSHFPLRFAESFHHLDEIWAPSRFCEEAFRSISPIDVRWVPPAVQLPEPSKAERAEFGILDDEFVFFFAFDALSIPERKNPLGLLDAFEWVARRAPVPTRLLLKVSHAEGVVGYMDEVRRRAAELPVLLMETSLERRTLTGLFNLCDAYVSLHRSEGLGLPLIEAMYLGKPVVATGYGGCTDFLDETTGWPVEHGYRTLDHDYGPYPTGAVWAEPDHAHAAELMLDMIRNPEVAGERVEAARQRVEDLYAPRAAAKRFRVELQRIRDRVEG